MKVWNSLGEDKAMTGNSNVKSLNKKSKMKSLNRKYKGKKKYKR